MAGDARHIVPRVYRGDASQQVRALAYEPGLSLRTPTVRGLPQAQRNALGEHFVSLFLHEFFDWGMVQTDPHFGNYRVRLADGAAPRLVLLDFGATRRFDPAFIAAYRELLAGGWHAGTVRVGGTAHGPLSRAG